MIKAYVIAATDSAAEQRYSAGAVYEMNGTVVFTNSMSRFDREGLGEHGASICGTVMAIQDCFNLQQFTGDDDIIISIYDKDVVAINDGAEPKNELESVFLEYVLEMSEKMTISFEMPYHGQEERLNQALELANAALKEASYGRTVRSAV